MSRNTEEVTTKLKLERGRQFQNEVKGAGKSLRQLGKDASWTAARAKIASKSMDSLGGAASAFSRTAVRGLQTAGFALGAFGLYAVKTGVQFNSTMQQNQIAFTQFLGSASKAKAYMSDLYQIAKETPFEFPQLTAGAQKLLAFGFGAEEAKRTLVDLADVASGMGKSGDDIDRMVTALGQIKAKGRLQGDEMLQLMENGIPALDIMAKKLGKTGAQTSKLISAGKVDSKTAIDAILAYSEKKFGGMSKKQSQTLQGQWSTMKDNFAQLTGAMTTGLTNPLTKGMHDANTMMASLTKTWNRKGLSFDDKMKVTKAQVYKFLKPYADDATEALKRAHLDQKLADAINWATPRVVDAFAAAAPKAAGAFVSAFLKMNTGGKIFALAYLAHKLGVFSALGSMGAARFQLAYKKKMATSGGMFSNMGTLLGGKWGMAFKIAAGVGIASVLAQAAGVENADPLLFLHPPAAGEDAATEKKKLKSAKQNMDAGLNPDGSIPAPSSLPKLKNKPQTKKSVVNVSPQIWLDGKDITNSTLKRARNRARRR